MGCLCNRNGGHRVQTSYNMANVLYDTIAQITVGYVVFYVYWIPLIARFMGPTWGPYGADRTKVGFMLAPWTLLSGMPYIFYLSSCIAVCDIIWVIYRSVFSMICSWNPPHWRQGPVYPAHSTPQLLINLPHKEPGQVRNHVINVVYPEYSSLSQSHQPFTMIHYNTLVPIRYMIYIYILTAALLLKIGCDI